MATTASLSERPAESRAARLAALAQRAFAEPLAPSPWDEQPIRGELFGVERLEEHARSLAAAQTGSERRARGDSLSRRLADNEAVRASLLKQLAVAATTASETSLQQQLNRVQARIAAEHHAIDSLLTEGHTAVLYVNVVPGAGAKHSTVGPLGAAFNRALHALEEILAIALIALAIALPFALCALALWWAASGIRQRARERAMRTA